MIYFFIIWYMTFIFLVVEEEPKTFKEYCLILFLSFLWMLTVPLMLHRLFEGVKKLNRDAHNGE